MMNHEQFNEWLYLSIFEELNDDERRLLEGHLDTCQDCRQERERIVRMLDSVAASGVGEPSNAVLESARQSLRAALWKEFGQPAAPASKHTAPSLWARLAGSGANPPNPPFGIAAGRGFRLGLALAATLAVGFFAGYLTFHGESSPAPVPPQLADADDGYTGISNIQIIDVNSDDGYVDILYDQVRPVRLTTSVKDQRAQDVLAYAILNEDNPGVRLKAISAFESDEVFNPPGEMKRAFLEALTSDPNPGVRLQALHLLRRVPFDKEVKTTLLFVLSHDNNPGIRIAAMNYLAEVTLEGGMPEREMFDILGVRSSAD